MPPTPPTTSPDRRSPAPATEPDTQHPLPEAPAGDWKILIVDDEPAVHDVTRLALRDFRFDGRGIELISARSGAEARRLLAQTPDIALVLLDVVMETQHAGLELVRYIRETLDNAMLRIVLRTGQPGEAPEIEVLNRYDINDYKNKAELTQERLQTTVITALRSYRQARSLRHLADELAQTNRDLADFNATVSHDLRSPLRTIASQILMLREDHGDALPDDVQQRLTSMAGAAAHASDIIDDLLEYSRIGRMPLNTGPVDMQALADACYQQERLARNRRDMDYQRGELPWAHANVALVKCIWSNLFSNALKYVDGASRPSLVVSAESDGFRVTYSVRDNGIGFDPRQADRIFDIFRRLHHQEAYEGTGIGLAIVRRSLEKLGGDIQAESEPGAGSVFRFTLPAASAPSVSD